MSWIFLSPHFDDAALSCGGLIWELAHSGNTVSIWTICGGEPPVGRLSDFAQELHVRWQAGLDAPDSRRREDLISCQRLGASQRYFSIPDCIYRIDPQSREFMYNSEESLNGELQPGDLDTLQIVQDKLRRLVAPNDALVCPLGLGKHVDHQMTRAAAEKLSERMWYYADYPYVLTSPGQLDNLHSEEWQSQIFQISAPGLLAWQDAIAAHASQISTFWSSDLEMREAIAEYLRLEGGIRLWQKA